MSDSEVASVAPEPQEEINSLESAVRRVCKNALAVDGLARGLHESAKVIDGGRALFVFLSESCDEPSYKKLVTALCAEKNVPLYNVPDSKMLGQWAGLCKIDADGVAKKNVGASCVAVFKTGEESEGLNFLRNYTQ